MHYLLTDPCCPQVPRVISDPRNYLQEKFGQRGPRVGAKLTYSLVSHARKLPEGTFKARVIFNPGSIKRLIGNPNRDENCTGAGSHHFSPPFLLLVAYLNPLSSPRASTRLRFETCKSDNLETLPNNSFSQFGGEVRSVSWLAGWIRTRIVGQHEWPAT